MKVFQWMGGAMGVATEVWNKHSCPGDPSQLFFFFLMDTAAISRDFAG